MATFPSHISQWRKGLKLSVQLSASKLSLQHIPLPASSCSHGFREIRLVALCRMVLGGAQCQDAPALVWFWGAVGVGGAQSAALCATAHHPSKPKSARGGADPVMAGTAQPLYMLTVCLLGVSQFLGHMNMQNVLLCFSGFVLVFSTPCFDISFWRRFASFLTLLSPMLRGSEFGWLI